MLVVDYRKRTWSNLDAGPLVGSAFVSCVRNREHDCASEQV